jgi:2,5-diamino-6-(ribosylamino)-4(3H)-pyrimidinone 5'-phosphate reductase
MLPRVILHNMVSVDGRTDWFSPNIGLYYEIASRWQVDAILSGSETILAGMAELEPPPEDVESMAPGKELPGARSGPLMVVVDSRGRIRRWDLLRNQPYWRDVVVLCSSSTPGDYLRKLQQEGVEYLVTGGERVDLRAALDELRTRYGVEIVRMDSGGKLNGVMLREGLVDEISLLVDPSLVGGMTPRSIFVAPDLTSPEDVVDLRLTHVEELLDGIVWLRYDVVRGD